MNHVACSVIATALAGAWLLSGCVWDLPEPFPDNPAPPDADAGTPDAEFPGCGVWYADRDGDGYGNGEHVHDGCDPPDGHVDNQDDCQDDLAEVHPGAIELCNGLDDDCDGLIDDDDDRVPGDALTWCRDFDGDGYGDMMFCTRSCVQPEGYVGNFWDCDDGNPASHPGATELCDGLDNDCNGLEDDGTDLPDATWYIDNDDDGNGNEHISVTSCSRPPGHVQNAWDCNDVDPAIHRGADEICDGEDNDCNGETDEAIAVALPGADPVIGAIFCHDDDGDGSGDRHDCVDACLAPAGFVANGDDCDDGDPRRHPGVAEICADGIDNDCDGEIDESGDGCHHEHCGTITGEEVWAGDSVHRVTCDVIVASLNPETALVVEAGARVLFERDTRLWVASWNHSSESGRLEVRGTEQAGVLFTSAYADPVPGDWRGVVIGRGSEGSVLRFLTVEYAGTGGAPAINIQTTQGISIQGSRIHHNRYGGLYLNGAGRVIISDTRIERNQNHGIIALSDSELRLNDSVIVDNLGNGVDLGGGQLMEGVDSFSGNEIGGAQQKYPLVVSPESIGKIGADNVWHRSLVEQDGTDYNYIKILGGRVNTNAAWKAHVYSDPVNSFSGSLPYFVAGSVEIHGGLSPHVEIQGGARFYFAEGRALRVGAGYYGSLSVVDGSETSQVLLSALEPQRGWAGLILWSGCVHAETELEHFIIEHAANGVKAPRCHATLRNGTIRHSTEYGLKCESSVVDRTGMVYSDNAFGDESGC